MKIGTAFIYNEERAKIVRHIFQMSISGHGGYTIAKLLNDAGVPAFGTSKRWDQSTIHNMLRSRATVGEYQKKKKIDGKEVPVGKPIACYYPAIVDPHTFEAAQKIRRENLSSRRGRKGAVVTNLFAAIPRCMYCNSTVKLHNAAVKSLICKKAWERKGCVPFKWTYTDFEKIAFAGRAPEQPSRSVIRKDHLDRYFELSLVDGQACVGAPALKRIDRVSSVDPNEISQRLGLSQRQGQITAFLAGGNTLGAVAAEFGMSLSTARWHLREAFKRTGCHSQSELIEPAKRAL